jgi:hypothetical protein
MYDMCERAGWMTRSANIATSRRCRALEWCEQLR